MGVETRSAARKRRLAETNDEPDPPHRADTKPSNNSTDVTAVRLGAISIEDLTQAPPPAKKTNNGRTRVRTRAASTRSSKPPSATSSRPPKTRTPKPSAAKEVKVKCALCMELFRQGTSYQCKVCKINQACAECFQEEATKALSKSGRRGIMNCWRCNAIVPLSGMPVDFKQHSKPEEVFQYNCRAAEAVDRHPLYCPEPRCSAFIPPRLYASPRPSATESHLRVEEGAGRRRGSFFTHFKAKRESAACCPKCFTLVCTSCRQTYHGDEDKCDPHALQKEANVRDLKQCPYCLSAVEHAGGCPIVGCSCGQYFCIICLAWPCSCRE